MDDNQLFLKKINRRIYFTQFLVWIALFFTAAGIAAGYKNWLRIHHKAKAGLAGIAEIRKEMPSFAKKNQVELLQASLDKQLGNNGRKFDSTLKELRQIKLSTEHIAESVYKQVEELTKSHEPIVISRNQELGATEDLSLSEIEFLLRTANQVLALKNDKSSARTALVLADNRLIIKSASKYLPLRKQISHDIALLDQYVLPNTGLLLEKINTLQKELRKINDNNVAGKNKKLMPNKTSADGEETIKSWVKKTINDAVVIHKYDPLLENEINEEEKKTLLQLLSLKLETLKMMLLQGENKNYHEQIDSINFLTKKYLSKKISLNFFKELIFLNTINLNPEAPDISKSLKLFELIRRQNKK